MEPLQVALSLAGVVLVIIACYYVTYYIGVKASGQSRGRLRNKNINIIDRFAISRDKSFCIVEIAGKIYVIGVTNQSMTLIDTLDAAAFNESAAERRVTQSWHAVPGGRITRKLTNKLAQFIARMMGRTPGGAGSPGGETFEESMRAAREKDQSGQPDRAQAERNDDPEE
jgi:flagellar biogenesis protein FliO